MSHRILSVHLDAGARCAARIDLAIRLARSSDARLVGIAPTGLPDVVVGFDGDVPDSVAIVERTCASLRAEADALVATYLDRAATTPQVAVEGRVVVDEAVDAVVATGRWSDLVVVGQTEPGVHVDGVASDFPQQVLLNAGCPVLVVPYAGWVAEAPGRHVLVAWQNTREAARALRDALPVLERAPRVTVLEILEPGVSGSDEVRSDARAWLEAHGIAATWRCEFDAHAGERILSIAAELGADLLVMGGYGHSRARERLLGGVTRHVLAHMTLPTFFSH